MMPSFLTLLWACCLVGVSAETEAPNKDTQLERVAALLHRSLADMGNMLEYVKGIEWKQERMWEKQQQQDNLLDQLRAEVILNRNEVLQNRNDVKDVLLAVSAQTEKLEAHKVRLEALTTEIFTDNRALTEDDNDTGDVKINFPRDCADVQHNGATESGVYLIYIGEVCSISPPEPVQVYCDLSTDGGGWTVLMRRVDDKFSFPTRNWANYTSGFGELCGSFWLGNKHMSMITSQLTKYRLRVELGDWDGTEAYADYSRVMIGREEDKFRLLVSGYSGTAGDCLTYHNGQRFSTIDEDNESYSSSCASIYHGAWWFKSCYHSKLTGHHFYGEGDSHKGIVWNKWHYKVQQSLMRAEMKIRPVEFNV